MDFFLPLTLTRFKQKWKKSQWYSFKRSCSFSRCQLSRMKVNTVKNGMKAQNVFYLFVPFCEMMPMASSLSENNWSIFVLGCACILLQTVNTLLLLSGIILPLADCWELLLLLLLPIKNNIYETSFESSFLSSFSISESKT